MPITQLPASSPCISFPRRLSGVIVVALTTHWHTRSARELIPPGAALNKWLKGGGSKIPQVPCPWAEVTWDLVLHWLPKSHHFPILYYSFNSPPPPPRQINYLHLSSRNFCLKSLLRESNLRHLLVNNHKLWKLPDCRIETICKC